MTRPSLTRVYKSGGFGRALALAVSALFLTAIALGLLAKTAPSPFKWPAFAVLVVVFLALPARAAMVGVWMSPTGIIARSWFKTWRLDAEAIRRCERVPYAGLLYGYGESRHIWMLKLSLWDGTTIVIRSTIAPRKTSEAQAGQLQEFLRKSVNSKGS